MSDNRNEQTDRLQAAPARRPYSTPRLVEYGSISKLTQGTKTNGFDAGGGGHSKNCL